MPATSVARMAALCPRVLLQWACGRPYCYCRSGPCPRHRSPAWRLYALGCSYKGPVEGHTVTVGAGHARDIGRPHGGLLQRACGRPYCYCRSGPCPRTEGNRYRFPSGSKAKQKKSPAWRPPTKGMWEAILLLWERAMLAKDYEDSPRFRSWPYRQTDHAA